MNRLAAVRAANLGEDAGEQQALLLHAKTLAAAKNPAKAKGGKRKAATAEAAGMLLMRLKHYLTRSCVTRTSVKLPK